LRKLPDIMSSGAYYAPSGGKMSDDENEFLDWCDDNSRQILTIANSGKNAGDIRRELIAFYKKGGWHVRFGCLKNHLTEIGPVDEWVVLLDIELKGLVLTNCIVSLGGVKRAFLRLFADEAKKVNADLLRNAAGDSRIQREMYHSSLSGTLLFHSAYARKYPLWVLELVKPPTPDKFCKSSIFWRYLSRITND
jgi:hypothetical protein